jgi:hypothetical protein
VTKVRTLKVPTLVFVAFATVLLASGSASAATAAKTVSWAVTAVQPLPEYGVPSEISGESCPDSDLCVAVTFTGDVLTSTDPTGGPSAWAVSDVDGAVGIDAVSCPGTDLCVAVDGEGDVLTSTDPGASGVGTWIITSVGWSGVSISCQSVSLCVAGDEQGDIYLSTDPTGGASAWTGVHVESRPVISMSCPQTTLCVGGDDNGNVVVSTDPTGQSWTVESVDAVDPVTSMSCTTGDVCVGTDLNGDVLTTNTPDTTGGWTVTQIDTNGSNGVQFESGS